MAIIKSTLRRLRHYPFIAIEQTTAAKLLKAAQAIKFTGDDPQLVVHLLECYCDVSGIKITEETLTQQGMIPIHDGFCGAIISSKLVDLTDLRKRRFCRYFGQILHKLQLKFTSMQGDVWLPAPFIDSQIKWQGGRNSVPTDKLAYWDGWPVENKRGRIQYLNLAKLNQTHGKEFTDELYRVIRHHQESIADVVSNGYDRIVNFLVKNPQKWPPSTFKDPTEIYNFFVELIKDTFKNKKARTRSTNELGHRWDRHINELYRVFIETRIWALPYRPLPLTDLKRPRGGDTHIRETPHGTEVRLKLITPIPLHVTQGEAIHILANKITTDVSIVREWATKKMQQMMDAIHRRKELAKKAIEKDYNSPDFWASDPIANIAGIFEDTPYALDWIVILGRYRSRFPAEHSSSELSAKIGVPTNKDIYAFQCALTLEHPLITDSFLRNFELYDINGNLCGIVEEGGKSYLAYEEDAPDIIMTGHKPRRGKNLSRQSFPLSPTALKIIDDLIFLTQQARDYLRSIGDDNWRKLFIASSKGILKPIPSPTPRWGKAQLRRIKKGLPRVVQEFGAVMKVSNTEEVFEFISHVTPSSIRASRCVEIYLQTGKTDIMRQALGHDKNDAKLLESYLPEILVKLIESRSIQVVQKIIICHSLRDSPFLIKGAGFETLEELEVFLKNYTSNELPTYLTDPEGTTEFQSAENTDEMLIRLGTGSLVALLSLRDAVNKVDDLRTVPPSYLKWANIADLIEKDIEHGFNRALKRKLIEVKPMINSEPFLRLFREKQ